MIAAIIVLSIFIYVASGIVIGNSVNEYCLIAKQKYQKDCVASLIMLVEDGKNSYETRNYAIWSLGQLGDEQALPFLEKYYTGIIRKKESYSKNLSQYKLKKAIELIKSGINITAFLWRGKELR